MNMKKKKILMIHHSGLIGGASLSFYNMWVELNKKYNVVSYIPDDPKDFKNFLNDRRLSPETFSFRLGKLTYYSGGNNALNPKFWYHAIHSIIQVPYWKKVIKFEKPDLIIVNSKVLCWMGYLFKNNKSLCIVRETIPGSPKKLVNKIMREMLENFSLVSFISKYDLKQTNLEKSKTLVTYNFLDPVNYEDKIGRIEACEKLNISPKKFNILFVGGINNLKGIDIALRAVKQLKANNEEINLMIAGNNASGKTGLNPNFLNALLKRKQNHKITTDTMKFIGNEELEEHVKFIGVHSDMSVPFSACDVLILPMKEPHQARPAFEIGVQKKPVIISAFPNIYEFVHDGVNGLTFERNNSNELAQALLKLKNNKELLSQLGENNYQRTIKYHTKNNSIKNLMGEIDILINK